MDTKINRIPIKDQIYSIIKENILNMKYELGEKLSILSLSNELKVSNTPIREALSMLERDGLVEVRPNAGPNVVSFSEEKFGEISETIEILLLGSLEIIRENHNVDSLIILLQKALKNQINNINVSFEHEYAKYSIAFEAAIINCCNNAYATKLYKEMESLFLLVVLYDHRYIDPVRNQGIIEHQRILSSIQSGDFNLTKELIIKHYDKF